MSNMYKDWLTELREALVKVRHGLDNYCGIDEQKLNPKYYCILCGKYFESFTTFDGHRARRECIEETGRQMPDSHDNLTARINEQFDDFEENPDDFTIVTQCRMCGVTQTLHFPKPEIERFRNAHEGSNVMHGVCDECMGSSGSIDEEEADDAE